MFVDHFNISSENNLSVFFLGWCPVDSVLGLPFFKGSVFGGLGGEVDGSSDESSQCNKSKTLVHLSRIFYYSENQKLAI